MHGRFKTSLCVTGWLVSAVAAFGQAPSGPFLNQQRQIEDEVRAELDRELPADRRVNAEWGGWYSFYLFQWDDGIESSRTYRQHDIRLWSGVTLDQGAHEFYARGKLQFQDFNTSDAFDLNDDDTVGPNLDRGFYRFDLRKAAQVYANDDLDWNLRLKVGRDLVEFGTGYALSLRMDHVLLTLDIGDFEIQGLGGMSIESVPDIDQTRPVASNSDRNFWGAQVRYMGLERHKPFAYVFWNEDQYAEAWPVLNQQWDYDSFYAGLGSRGELIENLRYGTELVFEAGRSYGYRRICKQDRIHAWAYDALIEYLSQGPMKPRYGLEYMFAGGDGDRRFSPTGSVGGNTRGRDTSFVGFGYRDTGLSFAPRLSNIHIWSAGASFLPFERVDGLEGLELGTDWFLYCKNATSGAVSDGTADRHSSYLGWEMDYFADWRITSDLSCTMRLGTFFPGDAFSDQTTRTFFLVGTTWSF